MTRSRLYLLLVLLAPLAALVGCPSVDSSSKDKQDKDEKGASDTKDSGTKSPSGEKADDDKPDPNPKSEDPYAKKSKPGELPPIFKDWPKPKLAIVISANQDGYIEPCGCIGLENQKGGLSRRATFLKDLADKGWPLLPIDGGGLVRRYGAQAVLKYRAMVDMLRKLDYKSLSFGTDDLRLPVTELMVDVVEEKNTFVSANVAITGDFEEKLTPDFRTTEVAGLKFGITSILGKKYQEEVGEGEIVFQDPEKALARVLPKMIAAKCDKLILLSHATPEETRELAAKFDEFDVIVTAGGATEPPTSPTRIEGKDQLIIDVGHKGMYVGVLGLYDDAKQPWRYERVPLDHRFADSEEGDRMMKEYQKQLKVTGLAGLGLKPIKHPSSNKFVGTEACADCHSTAYEIWKETPHAHGTDSIVSPPERRGQPRYFDPECISCHMTGWHPQKFYPYASGYESLKKTPEMKHVGCESCHGPGSAHVAAEEEGADEDVLKRWRDEMTISKKTMKESFDRGCVQCHDLDNSPDFVFDEYWKKVEHKGKD